eukprot:2762138-Pyramimonas_sp.AAC.1
MFHPRHRKPPVALREVVPKDAPLDAQHRVLGVQSPAVEAGAVFDRHVPKHQLALHSHDRGLGDL